ncbi:MAG: CoA pyrophosphatase [Rhodospirillaceae bacterium]|nr:CoA pyrophosphatase [Rhodospirillaceae bacterium]
MTRHWIIDRFDNAARGRPAVAIGGVSGGGAEAAAPARRPLIPAAVLVPLIERRQGMTVLLTKRTDHLSAHAGQVSFPGGRIEAGDAAADAAALREAEEEIGLAGREVAILGRLDTHETGTGYRVVPVVGLVDRDFVARPSTHEVEEAFEVPLDFFLDPANCQKHRRPDGDPQQQVDAFRHGRHLIWGATARILISLRLHLARP